MSFFFAPYGVLPRIFKEKGKALDLVMTDWKPDEPEETRHKTFNAWREDRLAEYISAIWPRYDRNTGQWVGPAVSFAKDLTEHEINVMISEFSGPNSPLHQAPVSPLACSNIETHLKHYESEDTDAPGSNYHLYDHTLSGKENEHFLKTMKAAITTKDGTGKKASGHFWFKAQMQRPRPLHSALLFKNDADFLSETSERGQHPSIVSGHCFQSIMMCCAVLEDWLSTASALDPKRQHALAQYMVDVGDRRVFAGVHYPSDNIASWALALSLIPEVFKDHQVITAFCQHSIQNYSAVYKAIQNHYFTEASAQPAIQLLAKYGLLQAATT